MSDDKKNGDVHPLLLIAGGALAGALWHNNKVAESKRSRAERDDPDSVEEVCKEIHKLLEDWHPDEDCDSENDYTEALFEYLDEESEWEVEMCPNVSGMQPDILISDLLAIELKLNPSKTEADRCIGQCAGYSREWVTWMMLIDTSASRTGWVEKLLKDKGLDHIGVWTLS